MLAWYQARLAARPLLTQSITTGILFATGDIVAQQAIEKRGTKGHDLARTGRMALYGGSVFGPVATTWFGFLARNVNFRSTAATTIGRVATDQLVFAPVMIGVFLSSMATLEGTSPKAKLEKSYFPALTANWMVWPAVQAFNFALVPLQHRLLFVNVISIGWNCFLSALNSAK
ncbi:Protein SYM1 like protein [Verticillium longisporum]|uniref:Protein SYM1 like protein n=1 Tax=Verticillium longisporum TaxID=100787 RepID=A0A0G4MXV8_VERLO|nr:Protein SYM1 like protein [Verticillium longisporum]KAG7135572.1 Protein SYM1 like protein [Verticillium longisporum]CRK38978.1 hypothetical protein BN1708_007947 [Verticillium longisporum]CRK38979.1 hypothetical protein BN1708_007948 [Verticillium longisporum]